MQYEGCPIWTIFHQFSDPLGFHASTNDALCGLSSTIFLIHLVSMQYKGCSMWTIFHQFSDPLGFHAVQGMLYVGYLPPFSDPLVFHAVQRMLYVDYLPQFF